MKLRKLARHHRVILFRWGPVTYGSYLLFQLWLRRHRKRKAQP